MKKKLVLLYGYVSYAAALGTILYTVAFVGDIWVPKSIDTGRAGPFWEAVLVDIGLLTFFAIQHSGMARAAFKQWFSKILPRPLHRSTYVLKSSFTLSLVMVLWRPLPALVWDVSALWMRVILWILYGAGWVMVFASSRMIDSGHFFGLRQVTNYSREKPMTPPKFQTPGFYRLVRHPLMAGFLIAFWAAPQMTVGHLLFSGLLTLYIVFAVRLEERDLVRKFGDRYRMYRERVPAFLPRIFSGREIEGK